MKKRQSSERDRNIIPFPGLERRLLERGQDYLKEEKYYEAIAALKQAVQFGGTNSDIYLSLALAYIGAGYMEEALELAKTMLQEDIGDYFSTLDLYIRLLYQAQQYTEIITVIEGLLEERAIPSAKLEHYYSMLEVARVLEEEEETVQEEEPVSFAELAEELRLEEYKNQEEQIMLAAELAKSNIQPYMKEILHYLRDESGDPFFKTLLLNVLKEHQVEQAVEINKFSQGMTIIPKSLPAVDEMPQLQEIIALIRKRIEDHDPVLYDNIQRLVHRQFFLLYPFPLTNPGLPVWAAAYHVLGLEYFGNTCIIEEILEDYCIQEAELKAAVSFIKMIEEISYSNNEA